MTNTKKTWYRCDNCPWEGEKPNRELHEIPKLAGRLDPGSIVPDGDCPECGAFVYSVVPKTRLLLSQIQNPYDLDHSGEFFVVELNAHVLAEISRLYRIAAEHQLLDVEVFCGDIIHAIHDDEDCEKLKLRDGAFSITDIGEEGYAIGFVPVGTEIPDRERFDCCTLHVDKLGRFRFECYLKHGGSEPLSTNFVDFEELGIPSPIGAQCNLISDTGDGPHLIGKVYGNNIALEDFGADLWEKFTKSEPDSDDQFVDFLKEHGLHAERDQGFDLFFGTWH